MLNELQLLRTTNGWRVTDQNGNSAEGKTAIEAKNLYFIKYKLNIQNVNTGINLDSIMKDARL